jgi:hypothetical protein
MFSSAMKFDAPKRVGVTKKSSLMTVISKKVMNNTQTKFAEPAKVNLINDDQLS